MTFIPSDEAKVKCFRQLIYKRTFNGLITQIYGSQRNSSKKRNHNLPNYTKKELEHWLIFSTNFKELYNNWIESNYQTQLIPSCDRINNDLPYSLDNLQLMTWAENKQKSHNEMRSGILKHGRNLQKPIVSINIKTKQIINYPSACEASRVTGVNRRNIQEVCNNKTNRKSAGGYYWKFK